LRWYNPALRPISMADTTTAPGPTADPGLGSRVLGIVIAPGETFQAVVARPRWFGVLALTTVISAIAGTLPLTTEAGKQAALDQNVRVAEAFRGQPLSDEEYEQMSARTAFAPYLAAGGTVVASPIVACIIAGLLWTVFNAAMGGNATFKQTLAVVVHAGVVPTLGAIFTGAINYVRGSVSSSAANLRVLLPMVDEGSFAGHLMAAIDFFWIWWVFVLAIGLAVLYRRRTQPIAITLFAVYAVIALCIAVVRSWLGGGA